MGVTTSGMALLRRGGFGIGGIPKFQKRDLRNVRGFVYFDLIRSTCVSRLAGFCTETETYSFRDIWRYFSLIMGMTTSWGAAARKAKAAGAVCLGRGS